MQKCPYCDFNSHALRQELDEGAYLYALTRDLATEAQRINGRVLHSVFIGGGTPSLFSGESIAVLMRLIANEFELEPGVEITLESNPGTADAAHYAAYREAGVNRLSIGVQSLNDTHLRALGRIHNASGARAAMQMARAAGFANINLDLMFGLPAQTPRQALEDLQQVIELQPEHISWYQLTLEPNTAFYHHPPELPGDDALWQMQQQGQMLLQQAGYEQYEISAYARAEHRCQHNLNYWQFGDYLGVGAGAHGKLSTPTGVWRYSKPRHPDDYRTQMAAPIFAVQQKKLTQADLCLESMMNVLRLKEGVDPELLQQRTGLSLHQFEPGLSRAQEQELLELGPKRLCPTPRGFDFLNDLLAYFS